MKPLYIFDLDETTGIYSVCPRINDRVLLRPGFREVIEANNSRRINMAIATRGDRDYVESIKENLAKNGIELKCRIYTEHDVETGRVRGYYKDYRQVFADYEITNPEKECVVIGDLLRIEDNEDYSLEDFIETDFTENPFLLCSCYSLNDHPYPYCNQQSLPVYAVLPRAVRNSEGKTLALHMDYVMNTLEEMYAAGEENFAAGFERMNSKSVQKVVSDALAQELLRYSQMQKYLIIKGEERDWSKLEEVMRNA
ncbi:hypothetical protein A3K73_01245 [Candidatus Pacearchaeota archaeon RBG_13_36_9]|nr:MAG: hypothetical protein A3K73_01245 [Candidatus Pacearchaeota archaeon RBG_13_36_9]